MGRARRKYVSNNNLLEAKPNGIIPSEPTNYDVDQDDLSQLKGSNSSNAFILSTSNQKKVKHVTKSQIPRKLSKKQRKKLERVVDQKKKKEKRAALLEALSTVQIKPSELAVLESVAHLGTRNSKLRVLSKRPLTDELQCAIKNRDESGSVVTSWCGKRKRRKLNKKEKSTPKHIQEESSDLSSSSDEDEEENETKKSEQTIPVEEDSEPDIRSVKDVEVHVLDENNKEQVNIPNDPVTSQDSKPQRGAVDIQPATYVHVERTAEVQEARLSLPILAEEQAIMEAIKEHPTVIICGQTGSGKTTQLPQFLYEAGYARNKMLGITEPRRVAAISMSKRVAFEMSLPTSKVSYQIRYENNVTKETCIKFMTDGVLARELKEDFLLNKYSVIVLDEAHERTANTDVLIGLLSRIVLLRNKRGNPLKLIIMSATLRIDDFVKNKRLFKISPPVVKIDVRQYSVTVHFNKKTPISVDGNQCPYLNEAYRKICKIHRTLPPGGILVFVTGKQEVHALKRKLNATFPMRGNVKNSPSSDDNEPGKINLDSYQTTPSGMDHEEDSHDDLKDQEIVNISEGEDEFEDELELDDAGYTSDVDMNLPMHVLPLYSLLSSQKQKEVFAPVPQGCRLCVVSTNVAETSLTIPGIKYIVDTGKVKKRLYDKVTGVSSFRVTWISKASANQRAGRAGRTESGHAYRLYSSAVFQDFPEFDEPEMNSKPVAGLVLQMKSMKIDKVINFPFPSPPPLESLESAEKLLISLGAIEVTKSRGSIKEMKQAQFSGTITEIGKIIASFPVHPRFGKMIAMATCHSSDIIAYVIAIVAALTVREIFITELHDSNNAVDQERTRHLTARLKNLKSQWSSVGGGPERKLLGDLMVLLGAIGSAEYSGATSGFCNSNCLRLKAVLEIRKLRSQLTNAVMCVVDDTDLCVDPKMPPPTDQQVRLLRQIILSAMGDHVARRIPIDQIPSEDRKAMRGAYRSLLLDEPVFIHPSSVLSRDPLPDHVIFQEMMETTSGKRMYMKDITAIEPSWLATQCPQFCHFSKPLEKPEPRYDSSSDEVKCHVTATFGRLSWPLGEVEVIYPPGTDRYRWFGRLFLEGHVMTSLKEYAPSLLARPATMVKSWSKLQPRTETLLRALLSRQVDSKKSLLRVWEEDSTYLRDAYLEWLPVSLCDKFMLSWPPA